MNMLTAVAISFAFITLFILIVILYSRTSHAVAEIKWLAFQIKNLPSTLTLRDVNDYILALDFYDPSTTQYQGRFKDIMPLLIKQAGIKYIPETKGRLTIVSKDE